MNPVSRYSAVTRRAFLGGVSASAIVATVGCAATTPSSSTPATSAASTAPSDTPSATDTPTQATSESPSSAASTEPSGDELPAGAQATVSWTFTSSGGRSRNPYMAVWIEDADGNFVKTLALYHKAHGDNWLDTLSTWYSASGGADTTTSGTVPAGSFTAVWDGSTAAGGRATQGSYHVCVESVVEHGAQSLVREQVEFAAAAVETTLTPSGDISAAAVSYTV